MQTRGYAATSATTPLAPFAFERRTPGDRDVHVTIDFCGICHSDIHFTKNEWGMTTYPAVPGHEITPDQINTAFERTNRGDVKYRFVVDCRKF